MGHAGLVARAKSNGHSLSEEVVVFHFNQFVEKDRWGDGTGEELGSSDDPAGIRLVRLRVDIGGSRSSLEEGVRRNIIDTALRYWATKPTKLNVNTRGQASCYWLGPAHATSHPLHPSAENAYAFSCTTFVHHCYQENNLTLVPLSELPPIKQADRDLFARWSLATEPGTFPRLCCGHLIAAFDADPARLPFRPADGNWDDLGDLLVFQKLVNYATQNADGGTPTA
jgi:hypothetical protein